ncbi:xanthine dehydrogenase family protein subunit M [Candidatus Dependentiae bacterium]|nr:xanthine dehydrogenase family protein subunit M [Candidatus Dependentiae bacterium]
MKKFKYIRPNNLKDACSILKRENDIKILAGGTDLLVQIKDRMKTPENLLDITYLSELRVIRNNSNYLEIGALSTHQDIIDSDLVSNNAGILQQACIQIGSPQIRNRGTIGGNIINASPAADTLPPLFTLESELILISESGERTVKIKDFFQGPGRSIIEPNEILKSIRFKKHSNWLGHFKKLASRKALAISKLSVAGLFLVNNGTIDQARIAFGAVGPTILIGKDTVALILNKKISSISEKEISDAVIKDISPISDLRSTQEYRKAITTILVQRILQNLMKA